MSRENYRLIARYSAIIFILPSCLAVGYVFGYYLDGWLGSSPWLTVLFLLLGGVAGLVQVFRILGTKS